VAVNRLSVNVNQLMAKVDPSRDVANATTRAQASALLEQGRQAFFRGQVIDCLKLAHEGCGIAEAVGDVRLQADLRNLLGVAQLQAGDVSAALPHFQTCFAMAAALRDIVVMARSLSNIGAVCEQVDEHAASAQHYRAAYLCLRGRDPIALICLMNYAIACGYIGLHRRANVVFAHCEREFLAQGNERQWLFARVNHARTKVALGQCAQGLADINEVLTLAQARGLQQVVCMALAHRAEVDLAEGRSSLAQSALQTALDLCVELGNKTLERDFCRQLAQLHTAQCEYEQALHYKGRVMNLELKQLRVIALQTLGMAVPPAAQGLGVPVVKVLPSAAFVRELAARAAPAARADREAPPGDSTNGADDEVLSARERHVLRWMADGLTNPEIGERLGISKITVRHHVSSILRKLAVASRTEAVNTAHQLGWL
jgi:DNA-binding CsgD family transcriptional regulator/tetratricopeptide (TPR) repeat protein